MTVAAVVMVGANAAAASDGMRSELEYGTVLFEYYQGDYFNALIEQEYAATNDNRRALSDNGQLLKGGMALSYGMADEARDLFDRLLAKNTSINVRNRAWYYLAKLYHAGAQSEKAANALSRIHGTLPQDLYLDYHYLATLVASEASDLERIQQAIKRVPSARAQYPYLVFNLAVSQLAAGHQQAAVANLQAVVNQNDGREELQVLADRARHGLAQIAMENQNLTGAWTYLQSIRTEGLYSNRALLAYAWAAIRQELYGTALPPLQVLKRRSIAIPEVQQGIVLLGHLYEQQGSVTRALQSHLEAEAALSKGIQDVARARELIRADSVPREIIVNLEAIVDESDWYAVQPSIDHSRLTPFLVDLMASNTFNQVLRQLADLYAIRENLEYWSRQTQQHTVILENAASKVFDDNMRQLLADSAELSQRLNNQRKEAGLMTLTLALDAQGRFDSLLENSSRELALLTDKIYQLQKRSEPYRQPPEHRRIVANNHRRIAEHRQDVEQHIQQMESTMRHLMQAELDKHEERMRYYLAQARLAKARLYDTTLLNLDKIRGAGSGGGQ